MDFLSVGMHSTHPIEWNTSRRQRAAGKETRKNHPKKIQKKNYNSNNNKNKTEINKEWKVAAELVVIDLEGNREIEGARAGTWNGRGFQTAPSNQSNLFSFFFLFRLLFNLKTKMNICFALLDTSLPCNQLAGPWWLGFLLFIKT